MNKAHLRTAFTAVTFFLTFLCLTTTFLLQIRMQRTLDAIAALPAETPVETSVETSAPRTTSAESTSDLPTDSAAVSQIEAATHTTAAPTPVGTQKTETVRHTTTTESRQPQTTQPRPTQLSDVLVLNTNTKKMHSPDCSYAKNIKEQNRAEISADELDTYLAQGYALCQHCKGYTQ